MDGHGQTKIPSKICIMLIRPSRGLYRLTIIGMNKGRWPHRRDLERIIKEKLFDTGLIDPRSYNKNTVAEAKEYHTIFSSLKDEEFIILFRRAASEYTLEEDYDNIEKLSKSASSQQQKNPAASKTKTTSNNLAPSQQHNKSAALKLVPNKVSDVIAYAFYNMLMR